MCLDEVISGRLYWLIFRYFHDYCIRLAELFVLLMGNIFFLLLKIMSLVGYACGKLMANYKNKVVAMRIPFFGKLDIFGESISWWKCRWKFLGSNLNHWWERLCPNRINFQNIVSLTWRQNFSWPSISFSTI